MIESLKDVIVTTIYFRDGLSNLPLDSYGLLLTKLRWKHVFSNVVRVAWNSGQVISTFLFIWQATRRYFASKKIEGFNKSS